MKNIWFVTGASKGLGLSLVKKLLAQGYAVAATSRNKKSLQEAVSETGQFLALEMDLSSEASVQQAVNQTLEKFGRIDVVVNNAGYGQIGSLEELSDTESRDNFEVNVFGLLNVIRATMPQLRAQQSGRYYNISSIGGFSGAFPGWGIYCATKFAVQGLSESFAAESEAFGVKVTIVSPGYFRTDFLTDNSLGLPKQPIEAYQAVRTSQQMHREQINQAQPGDPEKAVQVLIDLSQVENPPLHLFLGEDAYTTAETKIQNVQKDMADWRSVATSTGF
ncbi:SDR family oxidoreductase [Siphonobacter sp. SORGH_AS_1065]|uniref:SDR family oxidoreductase n=1 Tax=Siphonobacter sp. SORGH_AS_1065 TaxID=3041795 RepID=UPI0027833802|nr:SDR family oxidoreductase [Siphonobacter sp. SORGH_AS_1065]MDQ1087612.1 NAD(P)-dependent dehydrogenase (short-subunit alcohol dehydrogenase family) [Siphonobacter sp. SORGH_AS_1065]